MAERCPETALGADRIARAEAGQTIQETAASLFEGIHRMSCE
jgi:hypothetical protein